MFYYIYGGWGQGLEINDFPPSVKYLFSKQIVDESTHEMLYMDLLLKKGFVASQKAAFADPVCGFRVNSSLAYYVFSLRNLATYPHTIRVAALNLGPKILELAWTVARPRSATSRMRSVTCSTRSAASPRTPLRLFGNVCNCHSEVPRRGEPGTHEHRLCRWGAENRPLSELSVFMGSGSSAARCPRNDAR
jgi:hypothetical protein